MTPLELSNASGPLPITAETLVLLALILLIVYGINRMFPEDRE